ncbi:alpha/beta-hydrolase [Hypoxylon argillaceum]|nr:alpha/beta-hydrolase [Hypoxylon argillaceum]
MTTTNQPEELFHTSLNPTAKTTIVFLHALFCSHLEFTLLTPHLPSHHLLLIDLPAHSRSRSPNSPFTLANCAAHIANLIRTHAHGGRAHIVGVSAGGFVAVRLATTHPDLILSLFVSGATPFRPWQRFLAARPRALYPLLAATGAWVPDGAYAWVTGRLMGLLPHAALRAESKANFDLGLVRGGYGELAAFTLEEVRALAGTGVRTLVLAGEVVDDGGMAGAMGRVLRENGSLDSRAVVVEKAQHLWDLQFPELFARSVEAWVEGGDLPLELKTLE